MKSLGFEHLTVAHPKELSWIIRSKKKNDHVDSVKLAKLHMVNMIPEAHLLSEEERIFRDLLIQRQRIVSEISRMKISIIGYLKREGIYSSLPESYDNFYEKRRDAILAISFNNEKDIVLKTMLDRLEFLENQILDIEEAIKERLRIPNNIRLLMTIPGIDYYLASLLSSFIGDVNRFPDESKLASFFGVVPATRGSSSIKRSGHMFKDGAGTARCSYYSS